MHIRTSLILFGIALLLPAIIGTALGIGYIYDKQQQAYRQAIQETSHAMSLVLDREFARQETLLRTLAASPALRNGDLATFHQHAKEVAPDASMSILLHDPAGEVILHTRFPFGTNGLPPAIFFVAMRERAGTEGTLISDVFMAPTVKKHAFALQIPIQQNGKLAYLVLASVTDQLRPLFAEHRLSMGWFGSILDQNGVISARSESHEKFVGKTAPDEQRAFLREKREGFLEFTTLGGLSVTGFMSQVPRSGWTFVIGVPNSQLQQSAIRATTITCAIALLLLGSALALGVFAGRRIARPIEQLGMAASQLRGSAALAPQRSGILEIDAVNAEMVSASEEIRSTRADLERRIADAVANSERSQRALLQSQKMEALGRLTGGIAHDFNNILQALMTGLQIAYLTSSEQRLKDILKNCERAVDRASDLVRQLMVFGRVQDAHMTTVDLPHKLHEITPMLKGGLRSDIQLEFDIAAGVWPVRIDALQFELALLNLCINARDALLNGGIVRISIQNQLIEEHEEGMPPGDYVQVSVMDSGTGMSPEVLRGALDPFFTTKGVGHGSGLGLPQAYGFAKQAGGTLTIKSRVNEGTTIDLYLPRTTMAATECSQDKKIQPLMTLKGRILLVDDDPLVLTMLKPALESVGLDVRQAMSGDDALALLHAGETYDLILSDIVMPGRMSGIDLAEIVKTEFPKMRVVLATGYSERSAAITGVRILAKPYGINEAIHALSSELEIAVEK